jgi:carotenoid cleavage dioxygenase-like enzyme
MSTENNTSKSYLDQLLELIPTWVYIVGAAVIAGIIVVVALIDDTFDFLPTWLWWTLLALFIGVIFLKIYRWVGVNQELQAVQLASDLELMKTTRNEVKGSLTVYEGQIPEGMNGKFYASYPVGSVNSGGLPMPLNFGDDLLDYNAEYNTPLMNGDGMTLAVKFDGGNAPSMETALVKPPCYFADFNTRQEAIENESDPKIQESLFLNKFYNLGISRMGTLGARNLLNTAVTPVKFGQAPPFLLASYDVGRPFIMDPDNLKLTSPLGKMSDWKSNMPSIMDSVFGLVQSTAHPCFDPKTQELYSINFYGSENTSSEEEFGQLKEQLQAVSEEIGADKEWTSRSKSDQSAILDGKLDFLKDYVSRAHKEKMESEDPTVIKLFRWVDGKNGLELKKWTLFDENGGHVALIDQSIHQMSLTKNHIIFSQTSFKFSGDLLFNTILPLFPTLESYLREHFTEAMYPYTDCFVIKRSDLDSDKPRATAYEIKSSEDMSKFTSKTRDKEIDYLLEEYAIPFETIHHSCDYDDSDGIVFYGTHNTSSCVAEWIRYYDTAKVSGEQVKGNLVGMFALGSADINRIGKWVIDTNTMTIDSDKSSTYWNKGNCEASEIAIDAEGNRTDIGPNTWQIGMYTFRDMISATKTVDRLEHMWFVANGLDPDYLTEFIHDLYKDCKNRTLPIKEVVQYTEKGVPFTLVQFNCDKMQPESHYQFDYGTFPRSIHFINNSIPKHDNPQVDGFIFCTMQVPVDASCYRSEYWIFDASNVNAGPVCKMSNDGIDNQFCFTLHSAWLESSEPYSYDYNIDVREDYNERIDDLYSEWEHDGIDILDNITAQDIKDFFEQYTYKDWYEYKENGWNEAKKKSQLVKLESIEQSVTK